MQDLEMVRSFVDGMRRNGIQPPAQVDRIEEAVFAAFGIGDGNATHRLADAVRSGDAKAAEQASREVATPVVVDTMTIETAANDAIREALTDGWCAWKAIGRAYEKAANELASLMKVADPSANPIAMLMQKRGAQDAYLKLPEAQARVGSLIALQDDYLRVIGDTERCGRIGVQPDEKYLYTLARLFKDPVNAEKRAEIAEAWGYYFESNGVRFERGGDTMSRVLDTLRMGATPATPDTPTFGEPWPLPLHEVEV
jgi:hypothetical protein